MIQMYKSCWQPMGLLKNCPCQKAMLAQIESGQIPHSFIDQVMIHSHHRNDDPTLKTGKVDWCEFHEHSSEAEAEECRKQRKINGRYGLREYLDESELQANVLETAESMED